MDNLLNKFEPPFDVELWIKGNLPGASSLKSETLKAVEGFVILWNIFEGSVCNKKEKEKMIKALQRIAQNLASSTTLQESVNKSLSFYRNRYIEGREMKPIFSKLHFRKCDMQEHVEDVLKGKVPELSGKALALLIITYRIRNNIFHGVKSVYKWDEQPENILEASRILSFMIEDAMTRGAAIYE